MDLENLVLKLRKLILDYIKDQPNTSDSTINLWEHYLDQRYDGSSPGLETGGGFRIGNVVLKNPVVSAPLAGISDNTYRIIASFMGCSLTYSEMITSYGLYYNHKKSMALATTTIMERPCAVQIFGSDPAIMAEAAARLKGVADIIDINMGCPVPKIIKGKSGGYLLTDPQRAAAMVSKVAAAVDIPVTVKVRLGWDHNSINVLELAQTFQEQGAKAIVIHGRTVKQGFRGQADYEHIKKVKEKIDIPVIASGDIDDANKVAKVLQYTGCDGIMVGRSSKGRMWIFADILSGLLGYGSGCCPDLEWLKRFAVCYLEFMIFFKDEAKAVKEFRKYLSWIFKGIRGISSAKKDFFTIDSKNDALKVVEKIGDGM